MTGDPAPTPYLCCSGAYRWRSSTERQAAEQDRGGRRRGQAALAGEPVPQPDGREPRHQHELGQEREQPERVRRDQHQRRQGVGNDPAGVPVRTSSSMSQALA